MLKSPSAARPVPKGYSRPFRVVGFQRCACLFPKKLEKRASSLLRDALPPRGAPERKKCRELAGLIRMSQKTVLYTGAGISGRPLLPGLLGCRGTASQA